MSVPSYKRIESSMEFISNAIDLLKYTRMICTKKLPKQYTFYGGVKVYDSAENILKDVIKANTLNVFSNSESRQSLLKDALGELDYLSMRVQIIAETVDIDLIYIHKWAIIINKEISLINGLIKTDIKRLTSGI